MSLDEEVRELARAAGDRDLEAARRLVDVLEREVALTSLDANVAKVLRRVDAFDAGGDVAWFVGEGDSARKALQAAARADRRAIVGISSVVGEGRPRMWLTPINWDCAPEEGRVPSAALARISTEVDESRLGALEDRTSPGGIFIPEGMDVHVPTPENEAILRLRMLERDFVRVASSSQANAGDPVLLDHVRVSLPRRFSSVVLDIAHFLGCHLAKKRNRHGTTLAFVLPHYMRHGTTLTFVLPHYMEDPRPEWVSSLRSAASAFSSPSLVHVVAVRGGPDVAEALGDDVVGMVRA